MSAGNSSKEFFELVKTIGESRSKQEEDRIIIAEIQILKIHLTQPKTAPTPKKIKEYMIRAVYCEMLGHDASFAYVHAVKLTCDKNLFAKRVGYLTCNLFLHKDHELMLLLINTMQKDLNSPNHLEICAALTSVVRLVNLEMIPAIAPIVFKLLGHAEETVRKKAIISCNQFFKLDPETVLNQKEAICKVLCDQDPSVMGASLHVLTEMAKANTGSCKDLAPSFVSILKQIVEHRLPRDFDYHRTPAPWLQVKLLNVLGILGASDKKASEQMYEILQECMRQADSGVNVGYAIIYECVKCITRIYPDHALLALAASNISKFMTSDNHNLRYLGVTGLAQIVQVNSSYATEHQMVVLDCLEDPDESLKRKALDLLFRMTNADNVTVVVEKLTDSLRASADVHLRKELAQKIVSIAEKFAPNNEWYVETMNGVFELGGDLVPPETAYNLMRLVAEGTGEDEASDQAFRTFAVNTYLRLLEQSTLSDVLVQVISWVLGEYAKLANLDGYALEDIVDLLCECMDRQFEDAATRGYVVNALMKLIGQNSSLKSGAVDIVVRNYRSSRATDLQQRCYEFEQLSQSPALMRQVLPYDASCEDIVMNKGLTFLNSFVTRKRDEGAKHYQDHAERAANRSSDFNTSDVEKRTSLNFEAYAAPTKQHAEVHAPVNGGRTENENSGSGYVGKASASPSLQVTGARTWGPSGYAGATAADPPKPTPPPLSSTSSFDKPKAESTWGALAKEAALEAPEMDEKRKMANALFGGIGSSSKSSSAPARKAAAPLSSGSKATAPVSSGSIAAAVTEPSLPNHRAPCPPAASSGGGGDVMDLLDLDICSGPAVSSTSNPQLAVPSSGGGYDLVSMDLTVSSPPAAAPSVAAHILGPLPCSTQQVGSMWGQLATERRVQIATSVATSQDLMQRFQTSLNVQLVQIIGMECIAAGRVLPGNDPCFLHGKLASSRVEVLVRCRDPAVADTVVAICNKALI